MNRQLVLFAAVTVGGIVSGRATAGTLSGNTLELNTNPLPGVTVQAFRVNITGVMESIPFTSTVSSGRLAAYSIDLGAEPRVVLRFSAGVDRVVVFVPQPPNGAVGGAIDGRNNVAGLSVYVPRRVVEIWPPCCCPCPRPCFR